jgi:hypothetical protein
MTESEKSKNNTEPISDIKVYLLKRQPRSFIKPVSMSQKLYIEKLKRRIYDAIQFKYITLSPTIEQILNFEPENSFQANKLIDELKRILNWKPRLND